MVEDRISVVARLRPEYQNGQPEWTKNGERNVVKKDGSEIYTFDEVFDQLCNNEYIYDHVMKGLVSSALAGFNTAVCAYGQSGAGKTHTLTGSEEEDGVVQCTFRAFFDAIAKSEDRNYMLRISYVEIYNERVRDLLSETVADLPIYDNKDGVGQVEGLKEVVVTEMNQVEELLLQAQEHRQLGETLLNERSSRSHTIIRITIESHDVKLGGNATRCSIMNLVDLAGSENAAAAGTQGLRQKEGGNINRSLLALSKVVSSLASNQKFIPYRDSKLTRILKPSLGGNSKTVIICCVAPFSVSETSSTLKFAKLAKKIVTRPVVNEVNDDGLLSKYLREIELLKQELEKTKTKKENDEEERSREQRIKLAELMKGILNGRGAREAVAALNRKARRQTWAPGNGLPSLNRMGSLSPPCKRERILGAIEECGGQALDEKIHDPETDVVEKPDAGDVFFIPKFVSNERRSTITVDTEVQTFEPYPVDRSDEVNTLKKGNSSLAEQLYAKSKRCKELEKQKEEFTDAFESLKTTVYRIQEVEKGAIILESKVECLEREKANLSEEVAKLREDNASLKSLINENETTPADRTRLLHRIDELYEELCNSRREISQTKNDLAVTKDEAEQQRILNEALRGKLLENESILKEVRHQFDRATKAWKEEKEVLMKRAEELSAIAAKDADTVSVERINEINSLKKALAASKEQAEAATRLADETRRTVEKELQAHYLAVMKGTEEELQQLRKDNVDLSSRIDVLLKSSGSVTEEEVLLLQEEIAELKEVIDRKTEALDVAKTYQEDLQVCNKTIERLSREKKELGTRLNMKVENAEMLSRRVNALRDEINEKQAEVKKADNARKLAEAAHEKIQEENQRLSDEFSNLKEEYTSFRANVDSLLNEKDTKISMLQEQVKNGQHKILVLDTDLAIAQKDIDRYKNTITGMTRAHEEERAREHEGGHLKEQLNIALEELNSTKKAKEEAEEHAKSKEKMLKKAMDTIAKLETAYQSSDWSKEKSRLIHKVDDLQRQLRDATEVLEQRQASTSGGRHNEERKNMADEILRLREQLASVNASRASSSDKLSEMAKLKQDLNDAMKELDEIKEKNRRYRMQKVNGIQYVDELKEKISKLEHELQKTRKELSEKKEELQKVISAKARLESAMNKKENNPSNATSKGDALKLKERKLPLYEEPECNQQ